MGAVGRIRAKNGASGGSWGKRSVGSVPVRIVSRGPRSRHSAPDRTVRLGMTPAHGPDTADTSVVSAVVEFRGGSAMIPASRDVVHGFVTRLSERGLDLTDAFLDAARLVASELVTNALRHAPAPAGWS